MQNIIIIISNNNNNNNNNIPFGSLNSSGYDFLREVGRRLSVVSGDPRETSFLFKRLSILIRRFNSALIHEFFCFNDEDLDL